MDRFQWKQGGATSAEGMFYRNAITQISGCMKALECKTTLCKLQKAYPKVLADLQHVVQRCRDLSNMFERLANERTSLAYNLHITEAAREKFVSRSLREHLIQFDKFKITGSYATPLRLKKWISQQKVETEASDGKEWKLTWEALKECRGAFAIEDGAQIPLRDLLDRFRAYGFDLHVCSDEKLTDIEAEMDSDEALE